MSSCTSRTKANISITLTPEQAEWAKRLFESLQHHDETGRLPADLPDDMQPAVRLVWDAAEANADGEPRRSLATGCDVTVTGSGIELSGDRVDVDTTCAAIQAVLQRFEITDPVTLQWSRDYEVTPDMAPSAYGGGVVVLTAYADAYTSTACMAYEAERAFKEGRQPVLGEYGRYRDLVARLAAAQADMASAPAVLAELVAEANALMGRPAVMIEPMPEEGAVPVP